jgi:hypothetical protein
MEWNSMYNFKGLPARKFLLSFNNIGPLVKEELMIQEFNTTF